MPAGNLTDSAPSNSFAHLDSTIVLERAIGKLGIYPAVDTAKRQFDEEIEKDLTAALDEFRSSSNNLVLQREVGDHISFCAGEELGALTSDREELCSLRIEVRHLTEEVCIQATAKPLVGAEKDNQFVLDLTLLQQRVQSLIETVAQRNENSV